MTRKPRPRLLCLVLLLLAPALAGCVIEPVGPYWGGGGRWHHWR